MAEHIGALIWRQPVSTENTLEATRVALHKLAVPNRRLAVCVCSAAKKNELVIA
jgi:hypothetical protein